MMFASSRLGTFDPSKNIDKATISVDSDKSLNIEGIYAS